MMITTDIWTLHIFHFHFADSNWDMILYILATPPFPEHHTTVYIMDKMKQVVEEYNIEISFLLAVVHDHPLFKNAFSL